MPGVEYGVMVKCQVWNMVVWWNVSCGIWCHGDKLGVEYGVLVKYSEQLKWLTLRTVGSEFASVFGVFISME